MTALTLDIVTPEKLLFSKEVEMAVVPGVEGDFGVLSGHSPLISTIRPGVIELHESGSVSGRMFITGGFAEVTGERCTVLATEALDLSSVTVQDAEERKKKAKFALEDASGEVEKAEAAHDLAMAELLVDILSASKH